MKLTLNVWRQPASQAPGKLETYTLDGVRPDMSFLEMIDLLNETLIAEGEGARRVRARLSRGHLRVLRADDQRPGPRSVQATTTCQLHMRALQGRRRASTSSRGGQRRFPVVKDLVVDRSAFDRIIEAGGYISVTTGGAPDGQRDSIGKDVVEAAMDAAACIGCGACVAACPNASASLFTGAKLTHLGSLPQGQPERDKRVLAMVEADGRRGASATARTTTECEAACPKEIDVEFIARLNRDRPARPTQARLPSRSRWTWGSWSCWCASTIGVSA